MVKFNGNLRKFWVNWRIENLVESVWRKIYVSFSRFYCSKHLFSFQQHIFFFYGILQEITGNTENYKNEERKKHLISSFIFLFFFRLHSVHHRHSVLVSLSICWTDKQQDWIWCQGIWQRPHLPLLNQCKPRPHVWDHPRRMAQFKIGHSQVYTV